MGEKTEVDARHKEWKEPKNWSGRTVSHVRHRRRDPFGKVRVEYRCIRERCQSQCRGGPNRKRKSGRRNEEKRKWMRKQKSMKDTRNRKNERTGVDVLVSMFVTAAVTHLERSALNTDAELNAVKVNAVVDPIEKRKVKEETKKKEDG